MAFLSHHFTGYPREITAHPNGIAQPVHIRVGTSDVPLYHEILVREQYSIDLPFTPRTITDAGANIGLASIYYAHRFPKQG
jgi:hypothetical protein